ncbi:PPOX class probable FMN-dependent enzyme [Caulobacter ginsengisoli]|uniref:PPOX class probable FMN-dependent enzyme n=1 Tax=Caulobacter ginsengisoli TaxID=400775 RepID=A0ABU0IY88_9CAUL|nr:pyridoxamine 5'-phosphate oxidase family protein [Caulobacter ginsengisoli]MDQ0466983.1 PPOX class probable FMN-dependent enzyme [Caulobacter ginsengisoli]
MTELADQDALRTVYPLATPGVLDKVIDHVDAHARAIIALSPFVCIASTRPDGLADASPRGGEPGFVQVLDDHTLAMPDRPGNNRLDTLGNIVVNPGVGLLFFIPGVDDLLRVNGLASVTTAEPLMQRFIAEGKRPRSVVLVAVREVYLHCTKALRRSELWNPDRRVDRAVLPTAGEIFRDHARAKVPAELIDQALAADAKANLY